MSGLVPYQDFADSKGPLLWLIYGLGYLISPYDFFGVFLLSVLSYWATFYILYRTARLLELGRNLALVAPMLLSFFYFFYGMHVEMRTEDFVHLFMAIVFYVLVRTYCEGRFRSSYAFWVGFSCGCCLMLKYSYFISLLVPAGILFIYLLVKKIHPWRNLAVFFGGFASIVGPFVIYLLAVGALDDFIREYFLNTGNTIVNMKANTDETDKGFKHVWPFRIWYLYRGRNFVTDYMMLLLVALCFSLYRFRCSQWMVWSLVLWYALSVLMFSMPIGNHYFLPLSIMAFGGICGCVGALRRVSTPAVVMTGGVVIALVGFIQTHFRYSEVYFTGRDTLIQKNFSVVRNIINAREKALGRRPTITYLNGFDYGDDVGTNAVAGTRYWAPQLGMTPEMMGYHIEEVFSNKPDFVVICIEDEDLIKRLEDTGYVRLMTYDQHPPFDVWVDPIFVHLYMLPNPD